ncbi:hypothetical protein B5S28_g5249 [[Candida] boidinii]|nr:hypothetical protein B5S28_g5249 [[Candida] boidinii]
MNFSENNYFSLLLLLLFLNRLCLADSLTVPSDYTRSVITATRGCRVPENLLHQGFNVRLFDANVGGDAYLSQEYYNTYDKYAIIGTANQVPGIPSFFVTNNLTTTTEWGIPFNPDHFLGEFSSYFLVPKTGLYNITLTNVDNGAMIYLGPSAFTCCYFEDFTLVPDTYAAWAIWDISTFIKGSDSGFVYLEANQYIPMRIIYINRLTDGSFDLVINDPDGMEVALESRLFVDPQSFSQVCSYTTFIESSGCIDCSSTYTVSTTTLRTSGTQVLTDDLEVVVTPLPVKTTTTSLCYTCSSEYTSTTETVITTGSTTVTEAVEIVVTPAATITTTVVCPTCTAPVSLTTNTIVSTGTAPETVVEIIVSTPVSTLTTTVPCVTCTAPVTLTTETVITTGTSPVTVPEVIVSSPVSTLTTIVPCATCTAPVTLTTETVITTGSTTLLLTSWRS